MADSSGWNDLIHQLATTSLVGFLKEWSHFKGSALLVDALMLFAHSYSPINIYLPQNFVLNLQFFFFQALTYCPCVFLYSYLRLFLFPHKLDEQIHWLTFCVLGRVTLCYTIFEGWEFNSYDNSSKTISKSWSIELFFCALVKEDKSNLFVGKEVLPRKINNFKLMINCPQYFIVFL